MADGLGGKFRNINNWRVNGAYLRRKDNCNALERKYDVNSFGKSRVAHEQFIFRAGR